MFLNSSTFILANVGVPMLFLQMPVLIITLPLVIVIEAFLCSRLIQTSLNASFKAATVANLVSTLIGFPLLWFGLVGIQLLISASDAPTLSEPWLSIYSVTVQAPWLLPYEEKLYWMVPVAIMVLFIPAFFVSVFIEKWIYQRMLQNKTENKNFLKLSWFLHLASYAFLFLVAIGLLIYSIKNEGYWN